MRSMLVRALRSIGRTFLSLATIEDPSQERDAIGSAEQFNYRTRKWILEKVKSSMPIAASSVELIGLRDIERELGDRWPAVAAQAHEVAETVIKRHLFSGDVYTRQSEDSYALCFAKLNQREASQITKAIADEIKISLEKMAPAVGTIKIGHHVTQLNPSDVVTRLNSGSGFSVLDIIAESIATVRQEADDAYERQKRMLLEDASVVFSPSWSPALQRVVLHRCLLDDWTSKTTLQALGTVAEPEALQQAIADLDYLILGRAIGALHDALPNSGKTILLVPVHYLTLNQKRSRDEYVALCHKVPPAYRKFLLLEIYGIPAQATAGRLLLVSQAVQNYFNALVLSLPIATSGSTLLELSANGVYGVSVSLDEVHPGESQALHRYLAATKSANLRCFLHAIKTTGQLKQAVDAGIDYVSGEAVAPKTDAPRAAYAWKPLDSLMPRG